jgi:hypothetical protein
MIQWGEVPKATQGEKLFYALQATCNRINGIEHPWGFAKGRKVFVSGVACVCVLYVEQGPRGLKLATNTARSHNV